MRRSLCATWPILVILFTGTVRSQKPLPDTSGEDRTAYEAVCGKCHATSMADGLRSESEWTETIDVMIGLGAKGTDDQFARVLRHLLRTQTKVNVNTGTAAQIAPVLDITVAAAEALVKRRTEKGPFQTLEDLKKVPGMDAAKIDARKDRIVI